MTTSLPSNKTFVVDLDGTLCEEVATFDRSMAKPYTDRIVNLNRLFYTGNKIIIFTSRSWAEYDMTGEWLMNNGVEYDLLICGKPIGDYWIDDRSVQPSLLEEI